MDPDQLLAKYDAIRTEYHICKRKLDSKCEALLILSKELDECRSERDQFKLMAEQLRARYQDIKRQINGLHPISSANSLDPRFYSDMQSQSLAKLLCETKEQSKSLQFEVDDLKQKLQDAQGDIKLLREQIARQRVGTTDEGMNTRHFPAYEREDLVRQLEASREQLERDLQQVLDEKEEQVTERDIYRTKYERLNQELNYILRGDEKRIIDIDALSMENKYLKDRLKQMEEEKTIAMATVSKYKSILERKKNKGILKFGPVGQSRSGGVVISQKQVQQLLENQSGRTASPQALQDLQALASALLDTVNDKNLAISHQRKTNKILGNRVSELEKKLKTLEVSGLWNIPANLTCLEKLRAECEEVKTMLPRGMSEMSQTSQTSPSESWQKLHSVMSPSPPSSSDPSPAHTASHTAATKTEKPPVSLEDLDLLPTRDDSGKSLKFAEVKESIMNAFGNILVGGHRAEPGRNLRPSADEEVEDMAPPGGTADLTESVDAGSSRSFGHSAVEELRLTEEAGMGGHDSLVENTDSESKLTCEEIATESPYKLTCISKENDTKSECESTSTVEENFTLSECRPKCTSEENGIESEYKPTGEGNAVSDILESLIETATSKFMGRSKSSQSLCSPRHRIQSFSSENENTGMEADVVIEAGGRAMSTSNPPSRTLSPTCSSPLLPETSEADDSGCSNVDV